MDEKLFEKMARTIHSIAIQTIQMDIIEAAGLPEDEIGSIIERQLDIDGYLGLETDSNPFKDRLEAAFNAGMVNKQITLTDEADELAWHAGKRFGIGWLSLKKCFFAAPLDDEDIKAIEEAEENENNKPKPDIDEDGFVWTDPNGKPQ